MSETVQRRDEEEFARLIHILEYGKEFLELLEDKKAIVVACLINGLWIEHRLDKNRSGSQKTHCHVFQDVQQKNVSWVGKPTPNHKTQEELGLLSLSTIFRPSLPNFTNIYE
ncbi:unnamed protein product [Dovyalis caffra]|uniref:Uncharacterized protein n=1 Tax=Dovyalis caffra TaxID=77055 RepID=A0AAV1S3S9_9ROSI|nr:unnamed protein product [Dovyalis caffra]